MTISILTLFPQAFTHIFGISILKRAQEKGFVTLRIIDIRDFATDLRKTVDDKPYGGGIGMVLRVDVLVKALGFAKKRARGRTCVILLDPKGTLFSQSKARELTGYDELILIAGHYEGVDGRIYAYIDESISIGQFILTGGEIAAMAVTDAVVRLLPGVLKQGVTKDESFEADALEYPHYTRPPVFKGQRVPPVLLSGNHIAIEKWRASKRKPIRKTQQST